MAYDPEEPGLLEATKDALKELLADNIDDLATALERDTLWDDLTTVDDTMLFIGDPESVPPVALAPLWITISGGDESLRESKQTNLDPTGGYGYRNDFELQIRVYLHPDILPSDSPKTQAELRERALDRVCDWLRAGVCNTHNNKILTLASNEYGSGADILNETHITRIRRDDFYKNFGTMQRVRGAEAVWTGYIE